MEASSIIRDTAARKERCRILAELLAKHANEDKAQTPWFLRILGLAVVVVLANVVAADACTITQKKGEAPVITNCAPPATAAEAADKVRPNQTFSPTPFFGPRMITTKAGPERWQIDFLRNAEIDSQMKYLQRLPDRSFTVFYPTSK